VDSLKLLNKLQNISMQAISVEKISVEKYSVLSHHRN